MQGRPTVRRRFITFTVAVVSLIAAVMAPRLAHDAGAPAPHDGGVAAATHRPAAAPRFVPSHASAMIIDGTRVERFVLVAPPPPPPPTLAQTLQAATILVDAGLMAPPEPSLSEVLLALYAMTSVAPPPPDPAPAPTPTPPPAARRARRAAPAAATPVQPPPIAPTPTPAPPTAVPPTPTATVAPPPPAPPATDAAAPRYDAAFTQQVFDAVNAARAERGLAPLTAEPRLAQAAADYAMLLAETNTFSHTGPDGSTFVMRIAATGFPTGVALGEVLAMGSEGWQPAEVVQAWLESPSHRDIILGAYAQAGAGCVFSRDPGGVFVRCAMETAG